jgi:pentapeptide MXKDX repeat protein
MWSANGFYFALDNCAARETFGGPTHQEACGDENRNYRTSLSAIQGEQMKIKRILGIMMLMGCMSAVPATLVAQDQMKQDDMKHDDMKKDEMKHDDMSADSQAKKKSKKKSKKEKDAMKADDMKKDDMKKDEMKH